MAEADALKAKGLAEAEALKQRILVLNEQNQGAILDKAIGNLPEVAGKLTEAYGKIGNVTYIDSGNGDGQGVTGRMTKDVAGMIPLLGAMVESATGMKLRDMIMGMKGNNGAKPMVEPNGASQSRSVAGAVAPPATAESTAPPQPTAVSGPKTDNPVAATSDPTKTTTKPELSAVPAEKPDPKTK